MSIRIATAFVATIIVVASPAFEAAKGGRNGEDSYLPAQYCVPLDDVPDAPAIYCQASFLHTPSALNRRPLLK